MSKQVNVELIEGVLIEMRSRSLEEIQTLVDYVFNNKEECLAVLEFVRNGYKHVATGPEQYRHYLGLALASKLIPDDQKFPPVRELQSKQSPRGPRVGFVYLMYNHRNGHTKIGFSSNPKAREHTLASQEPEIELIAAWKGTMKDEEALHLVHHAKRLRGEWFDLSKVEISSIVEAHL